MGRAEQGEGVRTGQGTRKKQFVLLVVSTVGVSVGLVDIENRAVVAEKVACSQLCLSCIYCSRPDSEVGRVAA